MLRTHHSLKAFCATLWWRWRWAVFYQVIQVMEHQWNEIDRGNWQVGEKPVPVPLCPPQTPHGLTRVRTRASVVRGRRLTAWAMARPTVGVYTDIHIKGIDTRTPLTPCSTVLLEKLTGPQLVKKFPTFYGTRRFITALATARHLSLSWAISIQSTPPHPTSWRSILILSSHLRLGLPSSGINTQSEK
jgi:hypothetical protein